MYMYDPKHVPGEFTKELEVFYTNQKLDEPTITLEKAIFYYSFARRASREIDRLTAKNEGLSETVRQLAKENSIRYKKIYSLESELKAKDVVIAELKAELEAMDEDPERKHDPPCHCGYCD